MSSKSPISGRASLLALTLFAWTNLQAVAPTNNPVTSFYTGDPHLSDYAWTDELAWENVHNILDYGGVADGNGIGDGVGVTDNRTAFQAAVDAAHEDGGGVVYMPAGTYYFSDHLYLKSGVVVRGDTPVVTDAQSDDFAPPTKLEFPKYFFDKTANGGAGNPNSSAFKFIYVEDNGYASHLGLVWLDINRAGISLSSDGDGTEKRLGFGTRTNNVATPDPGVPDLMRDRGNGEEPFQEAWQRLSYRFGRNILVFGLHSVLVANNRCNDKHYRVDHQLTGWESIETDDFLQVGYVVQDTKGVFPGASNEFVALQEEHNPWFSYTNHYGINVRGSSGSVWGAAPFENPQVFRPGTTLRDNWVYTTMRVGYHTSGWGLKVLNNIKKDLAGKRWWIHPTGLTTVSGAQTLENRGLDISGSQILVDGNDLEVYRHFVNDSSYQSTDGEGILVQECCGGTTLDDIFITNNVVNAYIGIYKMPYTRDITISGNTISGQGYIMVNANKNGTQAPVFGIDVSDNVFTNGNGINVTGLSGGNDISIQNNTLNGGSISYPDGITTLSGNTGAGSVTPLAVGDVRDYPVLELEDPSTDGILAPGATALQARVTGSLLNPAPANSGELPDIVLVEIYANTTLLESFTTNTLDPGSTAWLYETDWFPAPGYYQLSAKAVPAGYTGPYTSTEWFTVSDMVPLYVTDGSADNLYVAWRDLHFPGETDPAIIGDDADSDMDGMPLLLEFCIGADPTESDAELAPSIVQGPSSLHLRFRMRDDLGTKVHYEALESCNLTTWNDVPITNLAGVTTGGGLPAGVREYEYVLPSTLASPRMMKLHIKRKP
jgi:hypothetical protein